MPSAHQSEGRDQSAMASTGTALVVEKEDEPQIAQRRRDGEPERFEQDDRLPAPAVRLDEAAQLRVQQFRGGMASTRRVHQTLMGSDQAKAEQDQRTPRPGIRRG